MKPILTSFLALLNFLAKIQAQKFKCPPMKELNDLQIQLDSLYFNSLSGF